MVDQLGLQHSRSLPPLLERAGKQLVQRRPIEQLPAPNDCLDSSHVANVVERAGGKKYQIGSRARVDHTDLA